MARFSITNIWLRELGYCSQFSAISFQRHSKIGNSIIPVIELRSFCCGHRATSIQHFSDVF